MDGEEPEWNITILMCNYDSFIINRLSRNRGMTFAWTDDGALLQARCAVVDGRILETPPDME